MSACIDQFVADLRADPHYADICDDLAEVFDEMGEHDHPQAVELTDSFQWIVRQRKTLDQKIDAMIKLCEADATLPIGTKISLRKLTGW